MLSQLGRAVGLTIFVVVGLLVGVNLDGINLFLHELGRTLLVWLQYVLWTAAGLAAFATLVVLSLSWRKYMDRLSRLRDGQFPVREYTLRRYAWWQFWKRNPRLIVDINRMQSAAAIIDDALGYLEVTPRCGWEMQLQYNQVVQTTRHLEALTPGDDALVANPLAGGRGRAGIANAATGQFLSGKWQPAQRKEPLQIEAQPEERRPPVERLNPGTAILQSKPDAFILGQSETGKLCTVNPRTVVNMAILGVTGTGKTASTGFQIAFEALTQGYQLIVLDGKYGIDWRPFQDVAEWHEADGPVLVAGMERIDQMYRHRIHTIKRHGVNHIADLDDVDFPPVLVMLEEFGSMVASLKGNDRQMVDDVLDELGRKGRVADIHFCLIDQYPRKGSWTEVTWGAAKAKILYKQGPNQGSKVGDYDTQNLPNHGAFRFEGETYNSWLVQPYVTKMIGEVKAAQKSGRLDTFPALIDGTCTVAESEDVRSVSVRPVAQTPPPSTSGSGHRTPDTGHPSGHPTGHPELTEIQRQVAEYLTANPDAGVRAMARDLGISKSYAGELKQEFVSQPSPTPARPSFRDIFGHQCDVVQVDDPVYASEMEAIRAEIERGNVDVRRSR